MKKKIVLILYIFLIVTGINVIYAQCTDLNNGSIIDYYSGDVNYNSETGTNDGTNDGTTIESGNCVLNSCFEADGSSSIGLGDTTYWDTTTQPITIAFAIRNDNTGKAEAMIIDKYDQSTNAGFSSRFVGGTNVNFGFRGASSSNSLFCKTNTAITQGAWTHYVLTYSGIDSIGCSAIEIYVNGVNTSLTVEAGTNPNNDISNNKIERLFARSDNRPLDVVGAMDEVYISNYYVGSDSSNNGVVATLYNSGTLCNPFTAGVDSTPPEINNIVRLPSNLTVLNAIETDWQINATITDNIKVNDSTVRLFTNASHIDIFINGVKTDQTNRETNFSIKDSSVYSWVLDENFYLSATHNLDQELFENTSHLNATLTTANRWVKIQFRNVSNTSDLVFSEIMDTNTTSNGEYYYCNDQYSTGNPIASSDCSLFHIQTDNDIFHEHGDNSFHRIMLMSIDKTTGELNGVQVSETSYILKRGSVSGETYYYIPTEAYSGVTQTTTNNGNVWTTQTYTVDSHLHQIHTNETIFFQICAEDNSSNRACSNILNDTIDFPILPPSTPAFIVPVLYDKYNTSMEIEYTPSVSSTGQTITTYKLEYKINTSSSWKEISSNNYPNTAYTWDITNILNGNYDIKLTVTDNLGYKAISISPEFIINNVESLNTQLLTDILAQLQESNNIQGEITMSIVLLSLIVFTVVLMILAFVSRVYVLLSLSGAINFLISFLAFEQGATDSLMYRAMMWIFLFLGIVFFIVGILLQILYSIEMKNATADVKYN